MTDYFEHKLDPVGVRPDWLADDDWFDWCGNCFRWTFATFQPKDLNWKNADAIRIPRSHWAVSYLQRGETPPSTRPTASEHPEYSPELVAFERIKDIRCEFEAADLDEGEAMSAICAILSELDKSKEVDPLEVKAREIVRESYPEVSDDYNGRRMTIAKAALLAGMELAKDEAA